MARLIRDTPVLKGKDALRFRKNLVKAEKNKISPQKLAIMKANYQKLTSIAKFS